MFHLTAHMLLLYLVKHNALFCTNYTAHRNKCAISRQSSASSTQSLATKQPGPKPSRLPHFGPDAAASLGFFTNTERIYRHCIPPAVREEFITHGKTLRQRRLHNDGGSPTVTSERCLALRTLGETRSCIEVT